MDKKIHPNIKKLTEQSKEQLLNKLLGLAEKSYCAKNNSSCWLYGEQIIQVLLKELSNKDALEEGLITLDEATFTSNCRSYYKRQKRMGKVKK